MTDALAKMDAVRDKAINGADNWTEPDWGILGDALPVAPEFPIGVFGSAAKYINRAAGGSNVPPDYPAAMLISAVGALVGKTYSIRINKEWSEPLIFWSALVGPPSSGKTPSAKPIRKKLFSLQEIAEENHRRSIEVELEALKAEEDPDEKEIRRLERALEQPPRFVVNDSTSEALALIGARSHAGLLVERDELSGLIEGLDRYSVGVDRAFYLEAWNDGPFILDRVKSGTTKIPNHSFSITGGIQPDRLHSLLTHAGDDDGFCARLLIFWPDTFPVGPIPSGIDHQVMHTALNAMFEMTSDADGLQKVLRLKTEAFDALNKWFQTTHAARRGISGKRGSAFGKLPGYAARLAGALHILSWVFQSPGKPLPDYISEHTMNSALELIETYFVPQIERAYQGTDRSPAEVIAAGMLAEVARRGAQTINIRKIRREWGLPGSRMKDAPAAFKEASRLLQEAGWLRSTSRQGGASDFQVHPALMQLRSKLS